jgi:hypothetical protein
MKVVVVVVVVVGMGNMGTGSAASLQPLLTRVRLNPSAAATSRVRKGPPRSRST